MALTMHNSYCFVCGKENCDISDKSGVLSFCSEECADNNEGLSRAIGQLHDQIHADNSDIRNLEYQIGEIQHMKSQTVAVLLAAERYYNSDEK